MKKTQVHRDSNCYEIEIIPPESRVLAPTKRIPLRTPDGMSKYLKRYKLYALSLGKPFLDTYNEITNNSAPTRGGTYYCFGERPIEDNFLLLSNEPTPKIDPNLLDELHKLGFEKESIDFVEIFTIGDDIILFIYNINSRISDIAPAHRRLMQVRIQQKKNQEIRLIGGVIYKYLMPAVNTWTRIVSIPRDDPDSPDEAIYENVRLFKITPAIPQMLGIRRTAVMKEVPCNNSTK